MIFPRAVRKAAGHEAGFTLVEMLVAVAILAVVVGIVPRSFVFARSIIDHSRDWMGARLVADAVLNDTLTGNALQPGARAGELDGRRWRATIRQQSIPGAAAPEDGSVLLDVRLEVDVSAGRTFEVETLRLVGHAEPAPE